MNTSVTRTDILQLLIDRQDLRSYLEVGVAQGEAFLALRCPHKFWVDPNPGPQLEGTRGFVGTSDAFFAGEQPTYDLIFIDGYHTHAQVARDLENARLHLNQDGYVVLHDMLPPEPAFESVQLSGTCWRAIADRRCTDPHFHYVTVDTDYGVGVGYWSKEPVALWKDPQKPWTLNYLMDHRRELMNVISPADFWSKFTT